MQLAMSFNDGPDDRVSAFAAALWDALQPTGDVVVSRNEPVGLDFC